MTTPPSSERAPHELLGRLTPVTDLRTIWKREAGDFTHWMSQSDNLALLESALDLTLTVEGREKEVGPYRWHPVRCLGHRHRVGIAFARAGEPGALLVRDHCRDVARRNCQPAHRERPPYLDECAQGIPGRPRSRLMIGRGCPRDETANRTSRATQELIMPWSRQRQASLLRPLPRTTCRMVRVMTRLVPLVLTIQIALNGPSLTSLGPGS